MVSAPKQELSGEGSARINFITNVVSFELCFLQKVDFLLLLLKTVVAYCSNNVLLFKSEFATASTFLCSLFCPGYNFLAPSLFCSSNIFHVFSKTESESPVCFAQVNLLPSNQFVYFLHCLLIWTWPHFILSGSSFFWPQTISF